MSLKSAVCENRHPYGWLGSAISVVIARWESVPLFPITATRLPFSIRLGCGLDFSHFWLSKTVLMLGFGVGFVSHLNEDIRFLTTTPVSLFRLL